MVSTNWWHNNAIQASTRDFLASCSRVFTFQKKIEFKHNFVVPLGKNFFKGHYSGSALPLQETLESVKKLQWFSDHRILYDAYFLYHSEEQSLRT